MMTFISLCAGIGGFDLGLERAGMVCKGQVEIDHFCQKILAKHWPDVKRYGDIRNVGQHNLEKVDLICGGIPCQPYSIAGEQRGAADDRHLWPEMLRVVREMRPRWVIVENVSGFVNLQLDQTLTDLEDEGYETWTFVLPAIAFDAPHIRGRVFIVAHSKQPGTRDKDRAASQQGWLTTDAKPEGLRQVHGQVGSDRFDADGPVMAYSRQSGGLQYGWPGWAWWGDESEEQARQDGGVRDKEEAMFWEPEPRVGRVANGVPQQVDRIKRLGNAVVPQVVEHIGRLIVAFEEQQ